MKAELMRRRYLPIPDQGQWLASVITGHMRYYAVPGNFKAVQQFRYQMNRHWQRSLKRRSQRNQITSARMHRLASSHLPRAKIMHPWPEARFAANHPW